MILSVLERLMLLGTLPKEGDFITLKIVRKLREDLSFNEQEIKELNLQNNQTGVQWNPEADKPKEIAIGEKATDIIVDALKKLNADKKLTNDHFQLYEKFVGE